MTPSHSRQTLVAILATHLAGTAAISAVEIHVSRDGRRGEVRIVAPATGTVRDLTHAVATLTGWPRGRHGGLLVDRCGYDALHDIAGALGAALGFTVRYRRLERIEDEAMPGV